MLRTVRNVNHRMLTSKNRTWSIKSYHIAFIIHMIYFLLYHMLSFFLDLKTGILNAIIWYQKTRKCSDIGVSLALESILIIFSEGGMASIGLLTVQKKKTFIKTANHREQAPAQQSSCALMTGWSWVQIQKQTLCICKGKDAYNDPPHTFTKRGASGARVC